jgi:ferredoxin
MLVDLMLACKPALAIMDAIVGMEGDGPAGGTPRQVGAVIASADCVALDVVASAMAGLDPMEVYSNKAAAGRGLGPETVDQVEIVGADWRTLAPADFALPAGDPTARMPKWLGRRLRGWTTARPILERQSECTKCKRCEESCPVGAVVVGPSGPVFDHTTCIRCYCCQELCPPQVIGLRVPPLARMIARGRRV